MRGKRSKGWNAKTLLIEFIFIVLAVTMALAVNEWNNDRHNQKLVDRILESSQAEIVENLERIEAAIVHRSEILESIQQGTHLVNRIRGAASRIDFSNKNEVENLIRNSFINEGVLQMAETNLFPNPAGGYWMSFYGITLNLREEGDDIMIYGAANIQLRPANLQSTAWQTANATNALIFMDYDITSRLAHIYQLQETYNNISNAAIQLIYSGQNVTSPMQDMLSYENELSQRYKEFLQFVAP